MNRLVALALLLCGLQLAQEGQDVGAVRLFAATSGGTFVSTDWGEEWRPLPGAWRSDIRAFVCLGPLAFAGGVEGLFRSEDHGVTWAGVEGWTGSEVECLLTSRYFPVEPLMFAGTRSGLYRSRDEGRGWERVGDSVMAGTVYDLQWPGPTMLAATSEGLFRSEDSGDTWLKTGEGLPQAPLRSLALSRYFGQDPIGFAGSEGAGLYRTRDGGKTWRLLAGPVGPGRTVYSLFWWNASLLAGTDHGLHISLDAGDSWSSPRDIGGRAVYRILVPGPELASGSDILVGTERGVFKSSDGALSWRSMSKGLGEPAVFGLGSFPVPTELNLKGRTSSAARDAIPAKGRGLEPGPKERRPFIALHGRQGR